MKNTILITLALAASFCFGFTFKSAITKPAGETEKTKRATGIGGIFFKCKEPKKIREWYSLHLGLNTNQYGTSFEWYQGADSTKKGYTHWSPFSATTKYFEPSTKDFMINYRVENLEALAAQLKTEEVTIVDTVAIYSYGKFLHILDPEGNKVELWEAIDTEYGKFPGGHTK